MRFICTHTMFSELHPNVIYNVKEVIRRNEPCLYCGNHNALVIPALAEGPQCGMYCEGFFERWPS